MDDIKCIPARLRLFCCTGASFLVLTRSSFRDYILHDVNGP
jgi:hypothetical protein